MIKSSILYYLLKRAGGWCKPVEHTDEWTLEHPYRTIKAVGYGDYVFSLSKTNIGA